MDTVYVPGKREKNNPKGSVINVAKKLKGSKNYFLMDGAGEKKFRLRLSLLSVLRPFISEFPFTRVVESSFSFKIYH